MRRILALGHALLPLAARHLVVHRVAASVALLAIASGVASIVATQLMYESVVASYEATVVRFAGRAALQVTNGESGVPEELADELRRQPGIRSVAASLAEFVPVADFPGEQLYLYGVDLLADHDARSGDSTSDAVVADPLVFLAEADSVALTRTFMAAHGLKLHDHIRVVTPAGMAALTIRAVLGTQRGPASAFDGRVAVVDLSVAQDMLQSPARVSQLGLEIHSEADVDVIAHSIARTVGDRGVVERPKSRAAAFARLLANYRYGLLLAAATSMIVALYFVFNIATIAVVDRRRELALLRVIGLRSRELVLLVLVELVALALVASMVGIPLGLGLARVLARSLGASVAALYLEVGVPAPILGWVAPLSGAMLGLLTTLLAVVAPIRQVLALDALEALRPAEHEWRPPVAYVHVAGAGIGLLGCSIGLWAIRARLPITTEVAGVSAMVGSVAAIALIVPAFVWLLATLAERTARRGCGNPTALLASRSITGEIGRVAITCSAGLVSLAGTIAIATWLASLDASLDAAFDTVFARIDLLVSAGADPFAVEATRMPASVAEEIARRPGVAFVDPIRINTVAFDGSLVAVVAGDARLYAQGHRRLHMIEGDAAAAARDLVSGPSVVISQTFASRFHRRRGDTLDLATPNGRLRVRIAGVYLELSPGDLATIHLDRALYRRQWRDDTVSVLAVSLEPEIDRRRFADTLRARWGSTRLVVFTLEQLRREYRAMLGHLSTLVYPLVSTSIVVAVIGIVSARIASMMMRVRVSGALRALGATRAQLTRVFVLEAMGIGIAATALAAVVGSVLGRLEIAVLMRGMLGMSVLYAYPHAVAGVAGTGLVLLTTSAGWVVGRKAAATAIGDALRWE